ncbi:MAG: glycosyltransferase [Candidatus Marinimicrobia bacterium]|nr:glycosyltransferase [Candidatus Neomarinimicrobiota bacterium]
MKIFIFTSVHPWNDTRIFYKEAISIAKRHEVELHAPAEFDYIEKNGVKIVGLPKWNKTIDRSKIRKIIWDRIKLSDADIFWFHDPELIWIGLKIKLFHKGKVIYDIHEDYYTQILLKEWIPTKILRRLIANIYLFIEKFFLQKFDLLLLAEKYYKNRLSPKLREISIDILNYPIVESYFNKNEVEKYKSKKKFHKIIYTGGITQDRGAFNVIEGFKILLTKVDNVKLYFVGKCKDQIIIDKIKSDKKLRYKIVIIGENRFVDRGEIDREYIDADIGLALFPYSLHYNKKLLTKFYEYMINKLPIIVSDFNLWKNFIKTNECGLYVDPTEPHQIADKLLFLINHPEEARKMGNNGYKAVMGKYKWKNEEAKLFKIKELLSL